jgi:ATP-dependent RNA helicase DDX49/DBP8
MGIRTPTQVQVESIPLILKGKNVCARSKTGSGKTAAFALPIIEKLSEDPYGIFALVLTPARELALQMTDQFKVFGVSCNIQVSTVIGGMGMLFS